MGNFIVMTFATTPELKELVEQWAKEDERSVSYEIRKAIEAEAQRRETRHPSQREVEYRTN